MKLEEIFKKCNDLRVLQRRLMVGEYKEIVVYREDMESWQNTLTEILGAPVKMAGVKPTQEDLSLTQEYGGIAENQILFYRKFEDVFVIAMIWPWEDGTYMTLKMVCLEN